MEEWTVCRLCLQSNAKFKKYLPDISYRTIPFDNIYFDLIGITFTDYEDFESRICSLCEDEMVKAYQFREKCLDTEEKLKTFITKGIEWTNFEFIPTSESIAEVEENFELKVELKDDPIASTPSSNTATDTKRIYSKKDLENKTIKCRKCSNTFRGIENFKQHNCFTRTKETQATSKDTEKVKENFGCKSCNKVFLSRTSYNRHMDKHNNFLRYSCTYCDKKFTDWIEKRTHIYKIHLKKNFCECPHCGKGFTKKHYMTDHINEAHITVRSYQCHVCGKTFNSRKLIRCHLVNHADQQTCKICGKSLRNQKSLRDHIRIIHKQIKKKCSLCSKEFNYNVSLKNHMRKMHTNATIQQPTSCTPSD